MQIHTASLPFDTARLRVKTLLAYQLEQEVSMRGYSFFKPLVNMNFATTFYNPNPSFQKHFQGFHRCDYCSGCNRGGESLSMRPKSRLAQHFDARPTPSPLSNVPHAPSPDQFYTSSLTHQIMNSRSVCDNARIKNWIKQAYMRLAQYLPCSWCCYTAEQL